MRFVSFHHIGNCDTTHFLDAWMQGEWACSLLIVCKNKFQVFNLFICMSYAIIITCYILMELNWNPRNLKCMGWTYWQGVIQNVHCGIFHSALRPFENSLWIYLYHGDSSDAFFENIDLIMFEIQHAYMDSSIISWLKPP
jgi:hypothetical protein